MEYVKNTFSNLAKSVSGSVSTKQGDLFWTYSAGGIPLATYGLLAATTVVLAASTMSLKSDEPAAAAAEPVAPADTEEPAAAAPATGGKRQRTGKSKQASKSKNTKRRI